MLLELHAEIEAATGCLLLALLSLAQVLRERVGVSYFWEMAIHERS